MLERNRLLQAREVEVSVGMAERPLTLDRAFGYGPINPEIDAQNSAHSPKCALA